MFHFVVTSSHFRLIVLYSVIPQHDTDTDKDPTQDLFSKK